MNLNSHHLFLFIICVIAYQLEKSDAATELLTLPSACNSLSDGEHYLQPLSSEEYKTLKTDATGASPLVYATCSNGYTIVNPYQDENFEKMFSSYHLYHSSYAGPDLNDHVTWQQWFLPSKLDSNTIFSISEDCQTCSSTQDLEYGDKTVYYMTGDSYGCNWATKGLCDFDIDTLECYKCSATQNTDDTTTSSSVEMYGKCGHMPAISTSAVHSDHSWCTEEIGGSQPSIGTTNRYCVCYKPSKTATNVVDASTLNYNEDNLIKDETSLFNEDVARVVYLSQNDFKFGTYRVKTPGTYVLTEDIEYDFNGGDVNDPNVEGAWYPTSDQSDTYPGAGSYDGWYWLGFFAGITIESTDVVLDLNGFELKQSPAFYIQQRWFVNIVLGNKPFLDGESPTWTGAGFESTKNVVIKNGIIGLSSHVGIHGSRVSDITLQDLTIRNFETHGIVINEHSNMVIKNVEVGPSVNGHLGLNAMYSRARISLPIMRAAAAEIGDKIITFHPRGSYTFQDLVDNLVDSMDLAFKWAYFGEQGSGAEWENAYKLFASPTGVSHAGTVYGIVLRPRGKSTYNYGEYIGGTSTNLYMENVKVHDLIVGPNEVIAISTDSSSWVRDTFNSPAPFELATDNNLNPLVEARYSGNILTDCMIALRYFSNDWWYMGQLAMADDIVEWATNGESLGNVVTAKTVCNFDGAGQIPKGVVGMKIEYLKNSVIKDVTISNLINIGSLGSTLCGEYQDGEDGGMPLQVRTTNRGYGGTSARGINLYEVTETTMENVQVSNVVSLNGPAHGMYIFDTCDIAVKQASFKHITGGVINDEDYSINHWPNPAAEGCGVSLTDSKVFNSIENIETTCVNGHTTCLSCVSEDSQASQSCIGSISSCSESTSYSTPFGEINVGSDGSINVNHRDDESYTPVVDNSVFQNSISVERYKEHLKSKSPVFNFLNVLTIIATIIIISTIIYYIRKQKSKYNPINNSDMYEVITKDDNTFPLIYNGDKQNSLTQFKIWIINHVDDIVFNIKTWVSNKYYHVGDNDTDGNNHSYSNNNDEYLNIDDIGSLHYQESAFLLSQQQ